MQSLPRDHKRWTLPFNDTEVVSWFHTMVSFLVLKLPTLVLQKLQWGSEREWMNVLYVGNERPPNQRLVSIREGPLFLILFCRDQFISPSWIRSGRPSGPRYPRTLEWGSGGSVPSLQSHVWWLNRIRPSVCCFGQVCHSANNHPA